MTPAFTCQELVEVITDYLEEKLPPPERIQFEAHLASCQGCYNYLAQMRRAIALTGQLSAETIPAANKDELLKLFRDWKAKKQP